MGINDEVFGMIEACLEQRDIVYEPSRSILADRAKSTVLNEWNCSTTQRRSWRTLKPADMALFPFAWRRRSTASRTTLPSRVRQLDTHFQFAMCASIVVPVLCSRCVARFRPCQGFQHDQLSSSSTSIKKLGKLLAFRNPDNDSTRNQPSVTYGIPLLLQKFSLPQ